MSSVDFGSYKKLIHNKSSPSLSAGPLEKRGNILQKLMGLAKKITRKDNGIGKQIAIWGSICVKKNQR
jgi:hypothetical protein